MRMSNIFGWSLPPGVTNAMIEAAYGGDIPVQCEDCEYFDRETGECKHLGESDE